MSEWWKGAVIYQIYPRSFYDHNGDGIGDLKGITEKLNYVASLGVDGIWLSPIFTSPMHDHGYDVSDYRDIDPIFGTLDDFDALLNKAHKIGLKVIIDQVYSHTSSDHKWFQESRQNRTNPKADWYVWADPLHDGSPPNNWQSMFGGIAWEWEPKRQQYYLHNFIKQQPDLNFHNLEVQEEILDTAKFWLDRGVDGFRLDVVNFYFHSTSLINNPPFVPEKLSQIGKNPPQHPYFYQDNIHNITQPENIEFLKKLRTLLDHYNDTMSVGEIFDEFKICAQYTTGTDYLHTSYSFPFLKSTTLSPEFIQTVLSQWSFVDAWPSWSFSNHDVIRAVTRYNQEGNPQFAKVLIALLTCFRGTAFLYQGDELGLTEGKIPPELIQDPAAMNSGDASNSRDGCRTPMVWNKDENNMGYSKSTPWLPIDKTHENLSVSEQEQDENSILHFTRNFLKLRKKIPALITGDLNFLPPIDGAEGFIGFERKLKNDRVICGFNLSDETIEIDASELILIECGLGAWKRDDKIILNGHHGFLARHPL